MRRQRFLALTAAGAGFRPLAARATGGLDIETAEGRHPIRVLLATGSFPSPEPIDAWHFAWNGRTYRGVCATATLGDGRLGLINTLPIDAYLYGVLAKEISPSWPSAAQQAQAIVARTYVLGKRKPLGPYDVLAGEADQEYGGTANESVQGRAAIDATGGIVLTYAGGPAHVAYSACCGGRTAAAVDVWNTPYPYLPGIVDPYCAGSPPFEWHATIALPELESAFAAYGEIGALRSVAIDVPAPGARPTSISIVGSATSFATSPKDFRASLGAGIVRSTFVHSATVEAGSLLALAGTGRGHGVGVCQWGARGLAASGATAKDIVAFYLPGTEFGLG